MSDTSSANTASQTSGRVSQRKGNRKVRSGCITCKARKVKCDEGKPSCLRCVKTGRKCDGYSPPRPRVGPLRSPSPLSNFESPAECRAFDYYRNRSAGLLGGMTTDVDDFWTGLVVKLTVTEPAVRHAVLALSSLHETVSTGDYMGRERTGNKFALTEYGKAMSAVRSWDMNAHGSEPTAIPLLVCVLFICIEFLMNYPEASQIHICQGRLILSRMNQLSQSSPAMNMVRSVLVPIYSRLSLASFLFASNPEPIPDHLVMGGADTPMVFESLKQARDTLYHLLDQGLRFARQGKPAVYDPTTDPWTMEKLKAAQQNFLTRLAQWNARFTVLKTTLLSESAASKATQDLLYVYYHAATIYVSTALSPSETAFDDYASDFASIVSHASSAIAVPGSLPKEDAAFTFETEVLAPVYWVAVKCRHPLLRRAAVTLLKRDELQRRRENLWRARELVVVASRVIEMEEGREYDTVDLDGPLETYCHSDSELHIPISRPPSLTRLPRMRLPMQLAVDQLAADIPQAISLENVSSESPSIPSPESQGTDAVSATTNVNPECLCPPYGVPEPRRIKNTDIAVTKGEGVWITTFMNPKPGHAEWDVRKMFLKV